MNDEVRAAIARLEELKRIDELVPVHRFGSGAYGIQAVFNGGARHIKAYGFATQRDAELFKGFAETFEAPDDEHMREMALLRGIEVRPASEREKWLRFEVVKITEVVADGLQVPRE